MAPRLSRVPGRTPLRRLALLAATLCLLLGVAPAFADSPVWTALQPGPRGSSSRAAYDSTRHRMLVFGTETFDDGFAWALNLNSPRTWTRIAAPGGPSPRYGSALCYDSVKDRLIVFGGRDYDGTLTGTWALRFSGPGSPAWDSLTVAGSPPDPTSVVDAAFDATNRRMILLSGTGTAAFLSLPATGTPEWTSSAISGPAPSPVQGRMRNAWDGSGFYVVSDSGDVSRASFDGPPAWTFLGHTGAAPSMFLGTVTYETPRGGLLVVANNLVPFWRIWLGGPGAPAWSQVPVTDSPPDDGLLGQTLLADPATGALIAFGGTHYDMSTNPRYSDTFAWDLSAGTWTAMQPPGGVGGAAVYDSKRRRMLLLRGSGKAGPDSTSVWALALSGNPGWTPLRTTGTPGSGTASCAVYDEVHDRLVLFTGRDTWTLEMAGPGDPYWAPVNVPGTPWTSLSSPCVAYDASVPRLLVFGGGNDTWQLTLGATPEWSELATGSPPAARQGASAAFDPVRNRLLIFGGRTDYYGIHNDVWALPFVPGHTATWQRLMPDSMGSGYFGQAPPGFPQPRTLALAAYDSVGDRLVVMEGQPANIVPEFYFGLRDAWALPLGSPNAWTQLEPTGSTPWEDGAVAGCLDVAGDRMVVFGGSTDNFWTSGATWFLGFGRSVVTVPPSTPRSTVLTLERPWPNPARGTVRLAFELSAAGAPARLDVYDVAGRRVRTLFAGASPEGRREVTWDGKAADGRSTSAGIYFARLSSGGASRTQRLILLR